MFCQSVEVNETQQVPTALQLKLSFILFISIFADMKRDRCLIDFGKLIVVNLCFVINL